MVEVKVDMKDKHHAEITFVGEDIAMVHMIRNICSENDDVEFISVTKDHPEIGHPKITIRVKKGNPVALVAKAAGKVAKMAEDLGKKMK